MVLAVSANIVKRDCTLSVRNLCFHKTSQLNPTFILFIIRNSCHLIKTQGSSGPPMLPGPQPASWRMPEIAGTHPLPLPGIPSVAIPREPRRGCSTHFSRRCQSCTPHWPPRFLPSTGSSSWRALEGPLLDTLCPSTCHGTCGHKHTVAWRML